MNGLIWLAPIPLWFGAVCLIYSYAMYPAVVWVVGKLSGNRRRPSSQSDDDLPTVSVLIAAFNEEAVIDSRLRNLLASDYPHDKLEIVIASDGSTDGTNEAVRRVAGQSPIVRLLDVPVRAGKTSVLNRAFGQVAGEIVVLSDANTFTDRQSLRALAQWFSCPGVGVVCGQLILVEPENGRNPDNLYWRYENFLKTCEGRLGSLLGANGGIYAVRKSLFRAVPDDTLVDDLVIPLSIKLRTGCEIVYEPGARAIEETPAGMAAEFRRRARIGAGGFQCIARLWRLLNPAHGWLALAFFSHKVLRWFGPFFMVAMLLANLLLLGAKPYRAAMAAQAVFYAVAALGRRVSGRGGLAKAARLPALFVGANLALLVGFGRWIRGTRGGTWERTAR
jgi:cellulose synthase/poly-beta-1,6-N-acetylglucosamine synthase-like glycosyltransferase